MIAPRGMPPGSGIVANRAGSTDLSVQVPHSRLRCPFPAPLRRQWLPQAFPSQACITPTAYCNGGQLNVCVGLGCDLWKNNTPHCIAQDPGPTNGGAAADEDIYARTDDGSGFKACQRYNHEPLP